MSLDNFVLFAVFLVISVFLWIALIFTEKLFSPKIKARGMGNAAVESGEKSIVLSRLVGFQYYFYALMFVIVEVFLVLLFLWSQNAKILGSNVFISIAIGLLFLILFIRYILDKKEEVV